MIKQRRNHSIKNALKNETLKIYNALLKKNSGRLQQKAGNSNRTEKEISVYEYLAIPTFVRHGKIIDSGY